jgi:glycosyltransferase involved in cell wall biosynthesis
MTLPGDEAPIVTVIIIFYNEERFLAEAVGSVFSQSLTSWELLLVDDGSTDGSAEIARSFAGKEPRRVRYLTHEGGVNKGMSASRNLGISHARGDYLAFLDADDIFLPDKLAEQVEILDRDTELAMVYGRTTIWASWDPSAASKDFHYPLGVVSNRRYDPPVLFELLMRNKAQNPTTCNAMMRLSAARHVGGFADEFRGMFEDQVFFARLLLEFPAYVDERIWARYRIHSRSCSTNSTARKVYEIRRHFLSAIGSHVRQRNLGSWRVTLSLAWAQVALRIDRARSLVGRVLVRNG